MRTAAAAIALILAIAAAAPFCDADWQSGQFESGGKPVVEFHCAPKGKRRHPAAILVHGAGPQGLGRPDFLKMCSDLAGHGYFAEFIEYYSQTDPVAPGFKTEIAKQFPVWMNEIDAGVRALGKNRLADSRRVALIGFSLGAYLAMSYGASHPDRIAAIVEYYGGLPPVFDNRAAEIPPTLILHGDADTVVPMAEARRLDELLTKAGRPHQIHIYPGASHAFNFEIPLWYDPNYAKDAWQRTLDFLDQYLKRKE